MANLNPYGTHMLRCPDDTMAERYRKGEWLGVFLCRRPRKSRDVIFVDSAGSMVLGEVMGWTGAHWRIGQFNGEHRYALRRLSRARWRPAWRVVYRVIHRQGNDFCDARSLGMYERAETIARAIGGECSMPPPLTPAERRSIPCVVRISI